MHSGTKILKILDDPETERRTWQWIAKGLVIHRPQLESPSSAGGRNHQRFRWSVISLTIEVIDLSESVVTIQMLITAKGSRGCERISWLRIRKTCRIWWFMLIQLHHKISYLLAINKIRIHPQGEIYWRRSNWLEEGEFKALEHPRAMELIQKRIHQLWILVKIMMDVEN